MSDFEAIVDSDAFVGLFLPNDAHHETCLRLFRAISRKDANLVTTNFTVAETATVLSRRSGQPLARAFLDYAVSGDFPVIYIDTALQKSAISIFKEQGNKNTSLFDCANVAVARNLGIPKILSFDKMYPKKFALPLAA